MSSQDQQQPPDQPQPPDPGRMASVLAAITAQARRTNLVRVADIRSALQRAGEGGRDVDGWSAAERTAHQLAGSAGTFGYARASDLARELETVLAGLAAEEQPDPALLSRALDLLDQLGGQLAAEPAPD